MIIIEGCDNSGKTQLAEYLKKEFSILIIKSPGHDTREFMLLWMIMHLLVISCRRNVVFDRFPIISESIYGPIIRGASIFSLEDQRIFIDLLRKVYPLTIYCRPPEEKILAFGKREQMDGVQTNAAKLIKGYDLFMRKWKRLKFPVVRYDFTKDHDKEKVKKTIIEWQEARKELV